MRGAQQGDVKALQAALDAGASADVKDASPFRTTALHWASQYGHAPCVRALLAANAAVDATNSFRQSALQCCTFEGHTKVAEILLAAGADPLHEDRSTARRSTAKHEAGTAPRCTAFRRRRPPHRRRRRRRRRRRWRCAGRRARRRARRRHLVVVRRRLVVGVRRRGGGGARCPRELRDGPSCPHWLAALCEHGDSLRDATARALLRPSVPLLLCLRRSCDSRAPRLMTQPLSVLDDPCYPLLMLHSSSARSPSGRSASTPR